MKPRTIRENVYLIGAVDWDRRLFDALIPLPDGTSYNAYFVVGSEKNVMIDTVDPAQCSTLMAQLDELPAPDYLVINHVEQDHSGCTPQLLERFPELTVVCNEKARAMLIDHLHVDDARFQVVGRRRHAEPRRQDAHLPLHAVGALARDDEHLARGGQDPLQLRLLRLALRHQRRLRRQARGVRRRQALLRRDHDAVRRARC